MFKRFGLGFAAGYVMGARGGEKHYERLTDMTRRVGELPAVRRLSEEGVDGIRERIQALVDQVMHRDDDEESDSGQSERASRRGKTDGENADVGGRDEEPEEDDFDDRVDDEEPEEDEAEDDDRNDRVTAQEEDGETDAGEPAPSGGPGRHRRPRREARANGGSHRSDRSSRQDDPKQDSGGSRRHGVAGFASTLLERGRVD